MAKKKNITESDIISFYMDYVLEHNEVPKSVYAFSSANNFNESLFYNYFGNFEALEKAVFKSIFDNTIEVLNKSDDYNSFDSRNKLLSLYYTLFENLTANRSYVIYALSKHKNNLKNILVLSELKKKFVKYIDELDIEILDFKQENILKLQRNKISESAWLQFIITIKFWMDDTSVSFEKTDVFIEKSVNTSFDLLDIKPLKSVIDLGKFLIKEKMNINV